MNPLVSIIIPTFNRAALIESTLNSILKQRYAYWECIVVDDGSTDSTVQILQAYCSKDARFKFYKRPKNRPKGANACRNYGLLKAKGTYVNWFDSDDLMLPLKLQIQVALLENSSFNYAICQTERFDSTLNKSFGLRSIEITSSDVLNDYITFKIFWTTGAPLWCKDFLISNKFTFDESLQQSQDYNYHINILAKDASYAIANVPLMKLVRHTSNMSNDLYSHPSKIYSNIKARCMALKLHFELLNDSTRVFLFKKSVEFLEYGIEVLNWKYTTKSIYQLISAYYVFKPPVNVFIRYSLKWLLGGFGYRVFRIGKRFFKLPPI
ncbi:glycosyltransferase family 2 protein [Confluentibacter citreus]|uniref:glycosyltransferase family 2 protein n=1 Tax=Confluentibacter citreus TaxID=2007307 RepID=UPI000C2844FA|nr:glycosyltransferase family 2 protein [Confluentibacter citreus]